MKLFFLKTTLRWRNTSKCHFFFKLSYRLHWIFIKLYKHVHTHSQRERHRQWEKESIREKIHSKFEAEVAHELRLYFNGEKVDKVSAFFLISAHWFMGISPKSHCELKSSSLLTNSRCLPGEKKKIMKIQNLFSEIWAYIFIFVY